MFLKHNNLVPKFCEISLNSPFVNIIVKLKQKIDVMNDLARWWEGIIFLTSLSFLLFPSHLIFSPDTKRLHHSPPRLLFILVISFLVLLKKFWSRNRKHITFWRLHSKFCPSTSFSPLQDYIPLNLITKLIQLFYFY